MSADDYTNKYRIIVVRDDGEVIYGRDWTVFGETDRDIECLYALSLQLKREAIVRKTLKAKANAA